MATGDEFIWESDALARFCDHPRADIRSWALERIRDRGATEAVDAVFAHVNDPEEDVAFDAVEALEALREKVSLEKARAPLYDLLQRDLMPGVAMHAASLLARSGDPHGVDRLEAECRKPSPREFWKNLIEVAPSRARALIEELGVAAKTRAWPYETVAAFMAVATPEEAPRIVAYLDATDENAGSFQWQCLRRAAAEHLWCADPDTAADGLHDTLDEFQHVWREPDLAAHGLTIGALTPVLEHLAESRWADAIRECAARCEKNSTGDAFDVWTRALCAALVALKEPSELHAWTACALAVAHGQRAILRALPFDTVPLPEQFSRACTLPPSACEPFFARVVARWSELTPDAPERAAMTERFDALLRRDSPLAEHAFSLVARLPGFALPRSALLRNVDALTDEAASARVRCLMAQPESLRRLAREAFEQGDERQLLGVLEALGKVGRRWVTEMTLASEEALSRKVEVEFVQALFADLGDPASLTALTALWRPAEAPLAIVVEQIATLAGRAAELPPQLVAEAQVERARLDVWAQRRADDAGRAGRELDLDAQPFRLDLACNRCGRVGRYIVERVTVHPDREKCQREGWDGYAFSQVIVCKYCGAEDDYRLTEHADRALTMHAFLALSSLGPKPSREALTEGRMWFGIPATSDGIPIRRQSDAVRHWTRKTEQNPHDTQAWMRLGNVLRQSGRYDPALAAYRRALAVRADHIEAMAGLLDTLVELGRTDEEPGLPHRIFEALPKLLAGGELRATVAPLLIGVMRRAVDHGQPLALMATWLGERVQGQQIVRSSTTDLRRIKRWERLREFIASANLTALSLKDAVPDNADTKLEELIESNLPLRNVERPAGGAPTPYVRAEPRIGRNDPCHCGSGKKYKKCHGK